MKFLKSISQFISCEVHVHGRVSYFAKLDDNQWVAVLDNGDLDGDPMAAADFDNILETLESIGAEVRFTNHSAA